jgi:hypothetical protein
VVFQGQFNSPQESRSVAMHEVAPSFEIGEADDSCRRAGVESGGEIYSGGPRDFTQEEINNVDSWSIMSLRSGIPQGQASYFVFSIQELVTMVNAEDGRVPCQ